MDEILERIGGPWVLIGALVVATAGGRKFLRSAAKEVIRAGLVVSDRMSEIVAEVREEASDLVAEVKAERKEQQKAEKHAAKAAARSAEA